MLQNTKQTASLKWNNHYEGLKCLKYNIKAVIAHIKNIRLRAFGIVGKLKDSFSGKKSIVGQVPRNYP